MSQMIKWSNESNDQMVKDQMVEVEEGEDISARSTSGNDRITNHC